MRDTWSRRLRGGVPFVAAIAVWSGALFPLDLPMVVGVASLGTAVLARRPALLVIGIAVASSVFAGNALMGLTPVPSTTWSGEVTLVADPVMRGAGTSVDVATSIGRLELAAWGPSARFLFEREAGERLWVDGRTSAFPSPSRVIHRHVRARLTATTIQRRGSMVPWMRPANAIRSIVLAGARALPIDQRPVYAGFVLGDDRGRSERVTNEFEAAGLSHLLVVSGENVVFVLLVLSPLLDRCGRRSRVAVVILVLTVFAAATRFEPSVLRATVMAGLAALTVASGRASSGRRVLAVTVVVLVLVDPLLVHSLGFELSVAAAGGIVVLGPIIERRLRGPRRLRAILAVTLAAQLAVAPLIIPVFGPMPLVAIPANIFAEPIAGLVMMWGCTGGMLAGIVGGPFALVLQVPSRLGLWWVMGVARIAASLPPVDVGWFPLAVVVTWCALFAAMQRRRRRHRPVSTEFEGAEG